jgi:hypothetical protein
MSAAAEATQLPTLLRARARLGAAALSIALLAAPAHAQVTTKGPLRDVDPWGVGWLSSAEGPLPATLWANADGAQLKPLLESIRPANLSPAARLALRRVILSAGKTPDNPADLILQRLRLLRELGESDHDIDLRRKFASTSWGQDAEPLDAARDLAASNTGPACRTVGARPATDINWMDLRTLCLALANDFDSAGAVAENYVETQKRASVAGAPPAPGADGWLIGAIEAMRAPTKAKPAARFDDMFNAALSIHAKLPVNGDSFRTTPPDVAAFVVRHAFATPEQKRGALRIALDGGKIGSQDVRAVYMARDEAEPARQAGRTPARPKADYIQAALAAAGDAKLDDGAKAAAYAVAFKSSENPSDFRLAAAALQPDLGKLPKNAASAAQAETFARAALVSGDAKSAAAWRALMDTADKDKQDKWAAARIDLMLSFAGATKEKPGATLDRLIGSLPPEPAPGAAAQPVTPASRQLAIRRIEVTRALFLYVGAGRDLNPAQRALLATQKTAGRGVPDAALARIEAALAAKSTGEAALAAIAQLGPDPSALSFSGLADLMTYLTRAGLDNDADAIALEALQVWKAI